MLCLVFVCYFTFDLFHCSNANFRGCQSRSKMFGFTDVVLRVAWVLGARVAGLASRVAWVLGAGVAGLAPWVAQVLGTGVAGLALRVAQVLGARGCWSCTEGCSGFKTLKMDYNEWFLY